MDDITIDDVDILTIHEEHPAFIIIVITGCRLGYVDVRGPFTEKPDTVGVCIGMCDGDARGVIEINTCAVVVEGTLIDSDKYG
jgi:hypothetical protein